MPAREHWGSRFGFIMATAGFAVGLGNIWRFPYVVGENGGAAFLIVYLGFAILIGIPLLPAETSLGRKTQRSPVAGMAAVAGRRSPWIVFAWLGIGTTFIIVATYLVLLSWIAGYLWMVVRGTFPSGTQAEVQAAFGAFVARPLPIERALPRMPNPWPDTGEQQVAADGTVLEMRSRISNVDPVGRVLTMQIRVGIRRNGALVDEGEYTLRHSVYSEGQLIALLVAAGCDDVHAVDGYQAAGAIGSGNAEGVVRVVLASAESSAAFDRR